MNSKMRKGFYFSFDAMLALSLMAASLAVVSQSSQVSTDPFQSSSIDYRKASLIGQDSMKLASQETFESFNSSFRSELVSQTAMESKDLDRTIIDGISLLWAARNFSYAEQAAEVYFDAKVPDEYEYRLQVNEGGGTTVIYQTSPMPANPNIVSSITRLVSGHKIDKPSEGFRARARATSITKNNSKVVSMPPLGMAPQNSKMEVRKTFWLNQSEKIYNGTFYLSIHYSGAAYFEQFKINGNQYGQNAFKWIHEQDTSQGAAAYGTLDVTSDLKQGKNTLFLRMKGGNSYNSHFHPGTKLEIKYKSTQNYVAEEEMVHKEIRLEDIHSTSSSGESGVFSVKQFTLPQGSEFVNATYHLRAKDLDSECGYDTWTGRQPGWDVQINLNEQQVHAECASGAYKADIEFDESRVQNGTNVVTTFIESQGDTRWGGRSTHLVSNATEGNISYIDLWYKRQEDALRFGEIRVSTSENIGGSVTEPKYYSKEFDYKDLESTRMYIAQLFSTYPEIRVNNGVEENTVFSANSARSAPTNIYIGKKYYNLDNVNQVILDDYDGSPERAYLPESTFQWTVWVPSQVGYGQLFENKTAAVNDAKQRLEDVLGPFVDATGIDTGSVSTGDQPYLWGPASVKLVIWDE